MPHMTLGQWLAVIAGGVALVALAIVHSWLTLPVAFVLILVLAISRIVG